MRAYPYNFAAALEVSKPLILFYNYLTKITNYLLAFITIRIMNNTYGTKDIGLLKQEILVTFVFKLQNPPHTHSLSEGA